MPATAQAGQTRICQQVQAQCFAKLVGVPVGHFRLALRVARWPGQRATYNRGPCRHAGAAGKLSEASRLLQKACNSSTNAHAKSMPWSRTPDSSTESYR